MSTRQKGQELFIRADKVMTDLQISRPLAYRLIKEWNSQSLLRKENLWNVSGKKVEVQLMSIIIMGSEKQREAPFLQLSNSIIRNSELSNQALGILVRLLIFPKDWKSSIRGYQKAYPMSGDNGTYAISNSTAKYSIPICSQAVS